MKFLFASLLTALLSFTVSADPNTDYGSIHSISLEVDGIAITLIKGNGDYLVDDIFGCDNDGIFFLPKSHANYSAISAGLFSSYQAKRKVAFRLDNCVHAYPLIVAVHDQPEQF